MINGTTMLKVNNSPSYEIQASNRDLPSLRALAYSAQKPNPITNQSVKIVTIIVGVFIAFNPYHLKMHKISKYSAGSSPKELE